MFIMISLSKGRNKRLNIEINLMSPFFNIHVYVKTVLLVVPDRHQIGGISTCITLYRTILSFTILR